MLCHYQIQQGFDCGVWSDRALENYQLLN